MSNPKVFEDTFNMLCGRLLGEGIHRKVFECKLRHDLVVKVEYEENLRPFANVMEMNLWQNAGTRAQAWLCPCEYLSPDGLVLLQKRVDPIPLGYEMPTHMPSFLTDFKRSNYGLLDGRLVCVDYALNIIEPKMTLRKAGW